VSAYAGQVALFEPGAMVAPGIQSIHSPGHTPAHCCFFISEDDAHFLIHGNIALSPVSGYGTDLRL